MGTPRNRPERKTDFYEGPPIHHCPTQEGLLENARVGSQRLKRALDYAGLRP